MSCHEQRMHIHVTCAIIERDGLVLAARRSRSMRMPLKWEFPGGKVEAGETLAEALVRELREELGVEIAVGEPLGSYRHAYTHFKVTVHTFRAMIVEGEPRALQSEQVAWVGINKLGEYPMGKVDRLIALELQNQFERSISGK